MRVALFSDLHIHRWSEFSNGDDRLHDCISVLSDVRAYCVEHDIKHCIFGGDLMHKRGVIHTRPYVQVANELLAFKDAGITFSAVTGNHDQEDSEGKVHALQPLMAGGLIRGVGRKGWRTFTIGDTSVTLFSYCDSAGEFGRRVAAACADRGSNRGHTIGVFHHGFKGAKVGSTLEYVVKEPIDANELKLDKAYELVFCVDDQTEALTPKGWKRQSKLVDGDLIGSVDSVGKFCWSAAKINRFPKFMGEVRHFGGVGGAIDHLVTSRHNLLVKTKKGKIVSEDKRKRKYVRKVLSNQWRKCEAKEAPIVCNVRVAASQFLGTWEWRGPLDGQRDDIAELVGWYLSEGNSGKYAINNSSAQLQLAQSKKSNPTKYAQIKALITRLGYHPSEHQFCLRICSKALATWFGDTFGRGSQHKKIPRWVKNWPREQLEHMLRTMIAGDGHECDEGLATYHTTSRRLANDVQEIAFKVGWGSTSSSRKRPNRKRVWDITLVRRTERQLSGKKYRKVIANYRGLVWCPTTETGLWIARRNGRVIVTGNSGHYHTHQSIQGTKRGWYIGSPLEHTRSDRCEDVKGFLVVDTKTLMFERVPLNRPRFITLGVGDDVSIVKGNFVDVLYKRADETLDAYLNEVRAAGARGINPIAEPQAKAKAKRRLNVSPTLNPNKVLRRYVKHKRKEIKRQMFDRIELIKLGLELMQTVEGEGK